VSVSHQFFVTTRLRMYAAAVAPLDVHRRHAAALGDTRQRVEAPRRVRRALAHRSRRGSRRESGLDESYPETPRVTPGQVVVCSLLAAPSREKTTAKPVGMCEPSHEGKGGWFRDIQV